MTQATDDLIARLRHVFDTLDREKAGYLAKIEQLTLALDAQAHDLAAYVTAHRLAEKRVSALRTAAQRVVDSAARELNYSDEVRLVGTKELRELARCVSSNQAEQAPAPSEETREGYAPPTCPRCNRPLNTISPDMRSL